MSLRKLRRTNRNFLWIIGTPKLANKIEKTP